MLAFSKADLPESRERFEQVKSDFDDPHLLSSATGEGVDEILEALWDTLEAYKRAEREGPEEPVQQVEYTQVAPFSIEPCEEGYAVEGRKVVRLVRMTDFNNEEAIRHMDRALKKMGLYKALKRMGAEDGQTIYIGGAELVYQSEN